MKSYQDVYKVTLTALSPVFIGSGRSILKQEYLLDDALTVHVFDLPLLYAELKERKLERAYEEFLERGGSLRDWMRSKGLSLRDLSGCVRYRLRNADFTLRKDEYRSLEILEFVKDPYGLPYVPGSSIKGMLRTVLLGSAILADPRGFGHFRDDIRRTLDEYIARDDSNPKHRSDRRLLKREAEEVETTGFRTLGCDPKKRSNAVNDILKGFIVSDSEPLSTDQLSVCQRIEVHKDGTEKRLNVTRECLKPGTRISFTLTVDRAVCGYSCEHIRKAVDTFGDAYNRYFVAKFTGAQPLGKGCVLLGGGCGYASKTVTYPIFGEDGVPPVVDIFWGTMPEKIFFLHKHDLDEDKDLAPHILKTARYQGSLYQTGVCQIEFSAV